MIRKNLMKSLSVIMAAMMAIMTVACGSNTVDTTAETAVEMAAEEEAGEDPLANTVVGASNIASAESEAGKVETVYVTADANGAVNDVIVSEWLKNAAASPEIADTTELNDIVNVKGDETFTDNGDGTLTWNAKGSDIYYQGTTDKQLPVTMKITYTLDGKEISPEELAGKSGKVTIRFEYENNDRQTVEVNGKEVDVYTPFAMVSGMMLDSDKFTNVEISNGKVISDGGNIIVMGVALPGLKESLDISDDKWDELEDADEIKDKLSNSFEITADTTDFELGMTITMASSDILSDFGMTDLSGSDKLDDLKSDMEDLNDGSNKLVDGTKELKDGTKEFADGTKELYDGATELKDGTQKLYDGTGSLVDGTGKLSDGAGTLSDGIGKYTDGVSKVNDGAKALADGTSALKEGTSTLRKGMEDKKLVESTKTLAGGSQQVSSGMDELGKLVGGLSQAMAGMAELQTMKEQVEAGQKYLTGESTEWNDQVAAGISIISGGKISDQATVDTIKNGAGSADSIVSAVTTVKDMVDSYGDNEDDVEIVTISNPDKQEEEDVEEAKETDTSTTPVTTPVESGATPSVEPVTTPSVEPAATPSVEPVTTPSVEPAATEQGATPVSTEQVPTQNNENSTSQTTQITTESTPKVEAASGNEEKSETVQQGDQQVLVTNMQVLGLGSELPENSLETSLAAGLLGDTAGNVNHTITGEQLTALKQVVEKLPGNTARVIEAVGTYNKLLGSANAILTTIKTVESSMASAGALTPEKINDLNKLIAGAKAVAAGNTALAEGVEGIYAGAVKLDEGVGKLNSGAHELADGTSKLVDNNGALTDGAAQLADGASQLADGAVELRDGAGKLNDGTGELKDGTKELYDGSIELDNGVKELLDGVTKFDEEGIKKIYEAFDGDLSDFTDRLEAIKEAGNSYKTFGGSAEDVDSSVKFIIKTDSIKSL